LTASPPGGVVVGADAVVAPTTPPLSPVVVVVTPDSLLDWHVTEVIPVLDDVVHLLPPPRKTSTCPDPAISLATIRPAASSFTFSPFHYFLSSFRNEEKIPAPLFRDYLF
jgi:hypothetical protein